MKLKAEFKCDEIFSKQKNQNLAIRKNENIATENSLFLSISHILTKFCTKKNSVGNEFKLHTWPSGTGYNTKCYEVG
jgi:hypothetical protein